MSGLVLMLALAGFAMTAMVITAMVLLTPGGTEDVHAEQTDAMGSNLSPVLPTAP